ncbi:hypothetical protein [Candidatus Nitrosocosmicus sp. T]
MLDANGFVCVIDCDINNIDSVIVGINKKLYIGIKNNLSGNFIDVVN